MKKDKELSAYESMELIDKANKEMDSGTVLEQVKILARYRRQLYLAYLAEGFTEEQALVLCMQKI